MIKSEQSVVILKFKNNIVENCIVEHQKIIEKNGFCWYGKIGKTVSEKIKNIILKSEHCSILLYSKGELYIGHVEDISYQKQSSNIPEYYFKLLYNENNIPSVYFKLDALKKCNVDVLKYLTVKSSGKYACESVSRCMNAVILTTANTDIHVE